MLTKLTIRNFKRFEQVEIELDSSVVFIGPNNSGKTTALQALALWELGLRRWLEKRQGKPPAQQHQGVTINRRDLMALPVPAANLLWRDLRVRNGGKRAEKQKNQNVRVDILIEGITENQPWSCGFEFDYANQESFYCRPLRIDNTDPIERMPVPKAATQVNVALLPPMSGLADREFIKQAGEISVLIGQGQTAQILRNLCYRVCWQAEENPEPSNDWLKLTQRLKHLFGVELRPPEFIAERSEIIMEYEEKSGIRLDISSSGRGLQQTLLILAHLYAHPNTILLLDEPDAHLEVLRQRQIYHLINELAKENGSQIIAASHSEVVLNEAANRATVVAFVGQPHVLNTRSSQVMKALKDLDWNQYYQAEQMGWVLYLEDSTDLAILKAFATVLEHSVQPYLDMPFVHYVGGNSLQKARDHFHGLREAKPNLVGIAIFDRLEREPQPTNYLNELMWKKREIENYFCNEQVLHAWAIHDMAKNTKLSEAECKKRTKAMQTAINKVSELLEIDDKSPWSEEVKATDEVLDRIFKVFFNELGLPLSFRKRDYHLLTKFISAEQLDSEVAEKLDAIVTTALASNK